MEWFEDWLPPPVEMLRARGPEERQLEAMNDGVLFMLNDPFEPPIGWRRIVLLIIKRQAWLALRHRRRKHYPLSDWERGVSFHHR